MHILAHHCVVQGTFESKGHASSDHPFVSFQILAEVGVLFIFELAVQSIGMHKTYLYSFFFWMDLRHTVFLFYFSFFPFRPGFRVLRVRKFDALCKLRISSVLLHCCWTCHTSHNLIRRHWNCTATCLVSLVH